MGDKCLVRESPAQTRLVERPAAASSAGVLSPAVAAGGGSTATAMASMLTLVPSLQAKLRVGSVDDPAEREADAVADGVLAILRRTASPGLHEGFSALGGGSHEEEEAAAASPASRIRRSAATLQRRAEPVVGSEGGDIDGSLAAHVRHASGGSALDSKIRPRLEGAFGTSFSDVRVHRDSAIAPRIGARAFTFGNDIHFAPGEYNPSTDAGMHVLSHELTHVVQQSGGAARAANRIARAAVSVAADRLVVRREVTKVWGKWRSSFAPGKDFADEASARKWDAEQMAAQPVVAVDEVEDDVAPEVEAVYVWDILKAARKHYNDGWGAAYKVRNDAQLRQAVAADNNTDSGDQECFLGSHKVKGEVKGCNILYSNTWDGDTCTTRVWHCGPTVGAG